MLAIVGTHRCGKSTLAADVAKVSGMTFIPTSVSSIFRSMGLEPDQVLEFSQRMAVQDAIIDHCRKLWSEHTGYFVTDRSPLDFLAYTYADLPRDRSLDSYEAEWLESYEDRCMRLTAESFSALMLLRPAIDVVSDPEKGSARLCSGLINKVDLLVRGLLMDDRLSQVARRVMRRDTIDRSLRLAVTMALVQSIEKSVEEALTAAIH